MFNSKVCSSWFMWIHCKKNAHKPHFEVKCKIFQSFLRQNKMTKTFNIVKAFKCIFLVEIFFLGKIKGLSTWFFPGVNK